MINTSIVAPAIRLAEMDMPILYGINITRHLTWRERLRGKIFARPGPKPRFGENTYRGRQAPTQLSAFMTRVGEYREDPVSFNTLDLMRKDPVIKLALVVRAAPVLTALRETRIKCEDKKIAAFIKEVFVDAWLLRVAESSILPSYVYGVAPHEKVWETLRNVKATYIDESGAEQTAWDGPATVYKKLKFVHPATLDRFLTQEGTQDFAGFVQVPPAGEQEKPVEAWKAFVYINRFLFGGLWGEAELSDVYPYWYYSEFFRALQADYLRYKAVPPIIGYAPVGSRTDQDGNEVDNLTVAGQTLQAAWDNLVVVLPYEVDDKGNQKWGYRELQLGQHSDVYTKAIEELDVQKLRGLIVPERVVTQNTAAVGSYNQADIHQERMLDAGKMEVDNFLHACNEYLVPQLVEDHFGPEAPPCRLFARSVSEALKAKLHAIVLAIIQNDKTGAFTAQVAFADLLDYLNIPFRVTPEGQIDPQIEPNPDEAPKPDEQKPKEKAQSGAGEGQDRGQN